MRVRKSLHRPRRPARRCARRWRSGRTSPSTTTPRTRRTSFRRRRSLSNIRHSKGPIMRVTQGCFSFLPDLTDDQIRRQIQYCLDKGWAVNIEFTDDPHPRNTYWEMWGLPMFDLRDAAGIMKELADCRRVYGDRYIRISGFDSSHGWESV